MEEFCILIFMSLFASNSLDRAESVKVKLEEPPLKTFDEIFGEGWWDKDEAEDLKTPPTNFGQNVHHQIDRQNSPQLGQIEPNLIDQLGPIEPNLIDQLGPIEPNSIDQLGQIEPNLIDQLGPIEPNSIDQLGQIEPNSTDQLRPIESNSTDQRGQIESNSTDQLGQIEPNSTDQLRPIESNSTDQLRPIESNSTDQRGQIESNSTDQLGQIEPNSTDQNPPLTENAEEKRKRKIVDKFHGMKNEFKQKGKYSTKEWVQIEEKIGKHLKINRKKIYKWKKELGKSENPNEKEERKNLVEKFDQKKAELKRDGFKNSFNNELDAIVAKELGLGFRTIYKWKRELGQTEPQHKHSYSKQKELMKCYYEIKDENPKIRDEDIAKMLKIGRRTFFRWKKQFKRQQFHPKSVDGHFVEANAAANVQEIENSHLGSI